MPGPTKITTTFYQQPDTATIGLYAENTVTGDELDRWEVGEFIDIQ